MHHFFESLYFASPVWAQQVQVALYGWWWYQRRFGRHFHRLVHGFREREKWTAVQLQSYQEKKLHDLFNSAWQSPYYHRIFTETGISPKMSAFDVLRRLPLLSKETLRTEARNLLTQKNLPKGTKIFRSSGTTGTPTEIYYTREFHSLETALPEARNLNWAGVTYRDKRVMFGVRKVCSFDQTNRPFWRFNHAENMAYASIYHLGPRFLPAYLDFLRSYQPNIIMGYPSALYTVARYALENNDLPAPATAVITTSETVSLQARATMEAAWQCKVWDRYGAVEGCVFASQCEFGRYHVSPDLGIVELLDNNGMPVSRGMMGNVVCTGLQNHLQPLIRYRIGDVAKWATDQKCPCNREMPILEGIEGRFEDICYTPDGRELLRFDTVFKGIENIREAQVVQEKLNHYHVYVVPASGFSKNDVEKIQSNMKLHVGVVHTDVDAVDAIHRSESGKFRAVVCKLSPEEKNNVRRIASDRSRAQPTIEKAVPV